MRSNQCTFQLYKAVLFAAILFNSVAAFAQEAKIDAMQPNIPNGGRVVAIARKPDSDDEFIIASETGGLFKSTDGGVKWNHVSREYTFGFTDVKYINADASHKSIIATANSDSKVHNGGGIWVSKDAAGSWVQIAPTGRDTDCTATLSANCIAIDPVTDYIWVGTSCGLAVSKDNGASFSFIAKSTHYDNDVIYAVHANNKHIIIVTDTRVKVSSDGGANWNPPSSSSPSSLISGFHSQLVCSPFNDKQIFWACGFTVGKKTHHALYFSNDDGDSWTKVTDSVGSNRRPTCYVSSSANANEFVIYWSNGACTLNKATYSNASPPTINGSWQKLSSKPHCDYADMCFKKDHKTIAFLGGDGGLLKTADGGLNWAFTGGGKDGYNALQINEVIGQVHNNDSNSDLYYSTQDNDIRYSPDGGVTWPDGNQVCCEGFDLAITRKNSSSGQSTFSGTGCSPCSNFISKNNGINAPLFPNPPDTPGIGNPILLGPGTYVERAYFNIFSLNSSSGVDDVFYLTKDNGNTWAPKYYFTEQEEKSSRVIPQNDDFIIFTPVLNSGTTFKGEPVVGLKQIIGVMDKTKPIVTDIGGIGSLGAFPTEWVYYKPYGVDLHNSDHLIVPDIINGNVRFTYDGGLHWNTDNVLTNLVTDGGRFNFTWNKNKSQISNISFDPDVEGRILVGTVQAGIFYSCDNGSTWKKINASAQVPNVSDFYFMGNNTAVASSYGRGLWKLTLPDCSNSPGSSGGLANNVIPGSYDEQFLYWKFKYVPFVSIVNPFSEGTRYYVTGGDFTDIKINQFNEVTGVSINGGEIIGLDESNSKTLQLPFERSKNVNSFEAGGDEKLARAFKAGYKVKGFLMEGKLFHGLILSKHEIEPAKLVNKKVSSFIRAELVKSGDGMEVRVIGAGFEKDKPITVLVDGKIMSARGYTQSFAANGMIEIVFNEPLEHGERTISVKQKTTTTDISESTVIVIPADAGE